MPTFARASQIRFNGTPNRAVDNMHQFVDRLAHLSRLMVRLIVERLGCRRTPAGGTIAEKVGPEHAGVPKAARIIGSLAKPNRS